MRLPDIKCGTRFTLPRPFGSADALLLARFGAPEPDVHGHEEPATLPIA